VFACNKNRKKHYSAHKTTQTQHRVHAQENDIMHFIK